MDYTLEQLEYINCRLNVDTKLLACAGSGKTKCIIEKINRLIRDQVYETQNILVLTFSRFTRDDFLNKIITYKASYIDKNSIATIDSFAKKIVDNNDDTDISILSYKLMKFLEITSTKDILKINYLKEIKIVFVDESQDLNETQFNILMSMKKKLNIIINLIGDPNQNIYQFRGSSEKYMSNFEALTLSLTTNFRSQQNIVSFSNFLRPFSDFNIKCYHPPTNCIPLLAFYKYETELETQLLELIKLICENGYNLSETAILSPTRGRMGDQYKSHGLC